MKGYRIAYKGEVQIYPEKSGLKPVLLLHSTFLLPSFFYVGRNNHLSYKTRYI